MQKKPRHQQQSKSEDKVLEWIKQYQQRGDNEAQTSLIQHYEPLVRSLSMKFSKGADHQEDLFQVGMVGLLIALRRFDLSLGKKFEAYAIPTIVGEIKRYIRDKTWSVHVPRRVKELGPKLKKTVEQLTTELQRSPTIAEIAEKLQITSEDVLEVMEMGQGYRPLSMDRSINADNDGGEVTLLELVGIVESGYERADKKLVIEQALQVLGEREKRIIQLTFLENLSQKETGERLGLSQMHISRLQRKALKKMRESLQLTTSERL